MKKIILCAILLSLTLLLQLEVSAIPNPMQEYKTLKQLREAVDFTVYTPSVLPKGYKLNSISTIDGTLVDLDYRKDDKSICYRTSKYTKNDISGVYTEYSENLELKIGELNDLKVKTRGDKGKVSVATFSTKKLSFSFYFDVPVSTKTLTAIIKGVLPD